ncbi:hypothetical protein BOTNAR_0893g00010 [Botryotinia narcissicola]|uniref:NAD(P)H-hydrate epimerase n=1 Tax=Botryotinia narcissicola TaxID=278944 RepID=A0A4Z1H6J0_9HELO|nr:hypothetical protein BOTNAR_0893g00010 [Botryotinia narcissicola]
MAAKYLSAANAAALDKDLMSLGAFSLDQLMELAGLSVSQVSMYDLLFLCGSFSGERGDYTKFILPPKAEEFSSHADPETTLRQIKFHSIQHLHPHLPLLSPFPSFETSQKLIFPKSGGDGLVAARHLWHYGYKPTIYYPKQGKNELYQLLSTHLRNLSIPFTDDFSEALKESDHIVDAIFGILPSLLLPSPHPPLN